MKKCKYCGKENDDDLTLCAGCGTPFIEPPLTIDQRASMPIGTGMLLQMAGGYIFRWVPGAGPHAIVALLLVVLGTAVLVWGGRRYAWAKGYPHWVGWLAICTCLGVVLLFLLPNRRKQHEHPSA